MVGSQGAVGGFPGFPLEECGYKSRGGLTVLLGLQLKTEVIKDCRENSRTFARLSS